MKYPATITTVVALMLVHGLALADPWKDESGKYRQRDEDFREDREEFLEEREERLEELREEIEERRERAQERAEEWREHRGWRGPVYVSPSPRYVQPLPTYERHGYEDYRYEGNENERPREFFVPPPPVDPPGYAQPPGPYLPPRDDDDDDLDAVYTPFGFYEEYPDSPHDGHGPRPRAHGQIGPYRFEIWK